MHAILSFLSLILAYPFVAIFAALLVWTFYSLCVHPLASIPGPKMAALTTLWKTYAVFRGDFTAQLRVLHAKYGKRVRIGPNEVRSVFRFIHKRLTSKSKINQVSIVSAHDISQIYGHKGRFIKGPFYRGWALFGTGYFSERNEEKHRISRNRVASIYSLNNVLLLEGQCDICSSVLFQKLDELAEGHAITDISATLAGKLAHIAHLREFG